MLLVTVDKVNRTPEGGCSAAAAMLAVVSLHLLSSAFFVFSRTKVVKQLAPGVSFLFSGERAEESQEV